MRRQLQGTIDARGSVAGVRDLGAGLMEMDLRRFGLPSWAAAMEEDDGAVELSLGLSVGGSSRKAGGYGADVLRREPEAGSGEAEADSSGPGVPVPSSSSSAPPRLPAFQQGDPAEGMDTQRRREMHVMRRQEVRNKRHEKQQKKGSACRWRDGAALTAASAAQGFRGCSPPPEGTCSADDGVALEAQGKQRRARDREAREEQARHTERRAGEDHLLGSTAPDVEPSNGASPLNTKVADLSVGNGRGIHRTPSRTGSLGSNSSAPISHHHSNSLHVIQGRKLNLKWHPKLMCFERTS